MACNWILLKVVTTKSFNLSSNRYSIENNVYDHFTSLLNTDHADGTNVIVDFIGNCRFKLKEI